MNNTPTRPGPGPDSTNEALAGIRDLMEPAVIGDLMEPAALRLANAAWHEGRAAGRREQQAAMEGQGLPCEVSPYAAALRLKLKAARA